MPKRETPTFLTVHALALADIAQLAGVSVEDVFLYSEHRTPTQERYVFQSWVDSVPEAQRVCLSRAEASENVSVVLAWCRAHPDEARELTENYRR